MLFSVEQAFVGRDEKRAPLKTPAWEAMGTRDYSWFPIFLIQSSLFSDSYGLGL